MARRLAPRIGSTSRVPTATSRVSTATTEPLGIRRPAGTPAAADTKPDGGRWSKSRLGRWLDELDRPGPHGYATSATTMTAAMRVFVNHPRPRVLLGTVSAVVLARSARRGFSARDVVAAAGCLVAQPLVEWTVHRGVLHALPDGRYGRAAYRAAGYGHEQHHRDPTNLDTMFLRPREVLTGGALALAVVATASPVAATVAAAASLGVLTYDWTHFLIHSGVSPRNRYFRDLRRGHRFHHFRNERYWLGVSSRLGDVVLQTNPARDGVPVTALARRSVSARPTLR